ncbi:hypothetical protein OEZ85_014397 [Tetradesmus obliquus]|uniref:Nucleoporin Nup133/Nup155-like N-terminal domain-containing protein n=1 Tax=Tetradesmus obliquus TaxID=3088 RepID=A0ABY8U8Q6_TETOB|nr:hypothetical protein OEZ85_014397 [Tetradesmus obliquus]
MAWAQCAAIAGDETGRLYGVARSDVHPGTFAVWVADVYPDALKTTDAQEAAVLLNDVPVTQVVQTVPAIDFDVTAAAASADGHQLLLVGATRQEDAAPVLALVDLYGSQPAAAAAGASSSSHPAAKQRVASLLHVHRGLYSERPSMRILKAAWHPSSPSHFAALSSDNRWRLYHTSRLSEAEQTFALRLPGIQQSVGLRRGAAFGATAASSSSGGSGGLPPRLTSFAFGPPSSGWASLAVLLLASNGGVYVLCPVAPFGMRVAAGALQRLLDGSSDSTAHAWLLAAFLSVLSHESEAVSARPHMLETAAPALQGPLNSGAESLKQRALRSVACTLALSTGGGASRGLAGLSLNPGSGSGQGSGFSVVATGFSNGSVYAHALELGQVLPVWLDGAPQCAYDKKGEVAAVRYEVEAVACAPAAAGLAPVAEESQQQSGTHSAAAAAGSLVSPLLLLDVLKINLHSPAAAAGTSDWEVEDDADSAGGSATDSDEETGSGSGGCLTFLRPRPAGVLGEGVLGGLGEGAGEGEGLGLEELTLSPEEVDTKGRMEDFYADICRGPRRLPAPQRPPNLSQLTPADPAGLQYLNDVASWLLRTHVEFANGAHADLTERARQLHDESHEQTAAIAALRELAAAAAHRQEAIAGRLARLGSVADTLAERSSLLAGLHWSLPRPPSAAEQQMDKQLEVWEQRRDQLRASWRALQARLEAYTAAAQQQQHAAAATPMRPAGSSTLGFGTPVSGGYGSSFGGYSSPLLQQQTPASAGAGCSPFLGVPALAFNRARDRRQVTKPPQGLVNPAKLQQLKEMLAAQNDVITAAREKLTGLFDEVEAYRLEHPEVQLPGRLRSSRVVV